MAPVVAVIMSQHSRVDRAGAIALVATLAAAMPVAAAHAATSTAPARVVSVYAPRSAPYMQTLLMFGTVRPDGGPEVTAAQFWAFVDQVVTPRFPDGLTVSEAQGQWRDRHGVIEREKSYEICLLYPVADAARDSVAIDEIRDLYKQRFAQEAVARVDEQARVGF